VTKRFYAAGEQIGSSAYFFTTDHLGSVREMTDATGAIRARYDYDPYGRTTKVSGNLEADFGFTGFYRHQASGLSLTLYRAYDANLGRWLSRDPIAENGGINLYAYVANNPIGFVDPYGLFLGTPLSAGEFFGSAFSGAGTGLFYAGKGLATAPYRLGQGVVSGYQQIGGLIGDAIVDPTFGSDLSNMASNPWQTTQAAGSAALDIGRGIVQDVKCKAQSSEGRGELWGDLAFATFSGAALNSPNVNVGIAVHGPHHSFGSLGRLSHVQMNWWETGVKGSGGAVRVPLPWR
jgi:RHS repeat-associated protein